MNETGSNRTNMTTLEGVNSYTYDNRNWLTSASYPDGRTQEFDYDPVGNRVQKSEIRNPNSEITTYTYAAANRLTAEISNSTTNSYTYDNAGRLIAQTLNAQSRSYAYSFRSQMTSLTDTNSAVFTYDFDGDGNRTVQSQAGCLSSRYVYDGPNVVLELNGSNQVTRAYVNGPGIDQPIERIAFVGGRQSIRYVYHTDGLGSVVAVTDAAGQTVEKYRYEAFGAATILAPDSRLLTSSAIANRYTFTAREALADSLGLYYYRWRVMDPNAGRFTSEDPLGFVDGVSLYRYVVNNPVSSKDPFGLKKDPKCLDDAQKWRVACQAAALVSYNACRVICQGILYPPGKAACYILCTGGYGIYFAYCEAQYALLVKNCPEECAP